MVVEIARARMCGAAMRKRPGEQLLGPGLADAAGDGDDMGGAPLARPAGQGAEPFEGIDDQQQRPAAGSPPAGLPATGLTATGLPLGPAAHHRRRRLAFERCRHEVVAVMVGPGECHEQVARGDAAAVDRDAGGAPGLCRPPAGGGGGLRRGPQRDRAKGLSPGARAPGDLRHGATHHGGIVEGDGALAHDLLPLVALAGDEEAVARAELPDGAADGPTAIADLPARRGRR